MNENEKILTSDKKPDYAQEIIDIIRGDDSPKVKLIRLEDYHENDIAEVISELTVQERKKFYHVCPAGMLAEIFEYFDEDDAGKYLDEMDVKKVAAVVSELETDTAVKVLHELSKEKRGLILDAIDPEVRKQIKLINSFDEDEIGSRMSTNFVVIRENLTIKQAMNELAAAACILTEELSRPLSRMSRCRKHLNGTSG